MRTFLATTACISLLFGVNVPARGEDARYKVLWIRGSSATLIDTKSITRTFAGKYRTAWMIIIQPHADLRIDYFQSLTRFDCGARSSRTEVLMIYNNGESKEVGTSNLLDKPIQPESSSEVVYEFVCKDQVRPDVADTRLLTRSELTNLRSLLADSD